MNRNPRSFATAMAAWTLVLGLNGCGNDDASSDSAKQAATKPSAPATSTDAPPTGAKETPVFGPACLSLPRQGEGSTADLSRQPIGAAIQRSPMLATFRSVLEEIDAIATLDKTENVTLFAPTDAAFRKLPKSEREALLADHARLGELVSLHVTGPRANSDSFATAGLKDFRLNDITVTEIDGELTVNRHSKIVCGDIQTANATIHLIDTVLVAP